MKTKIITLVSMLMIFALCTLSYANENANEKVAEEIIELSGGNRGDITFPHEKHEKGVKDCMICHEMFPQKTGSISEMKADGKLQDKQVMDHCINCHRKMKKAGENTGPTSCSKCHTKP